MNEATPPETPVWSTGVLVNFGGAETNKKIDQINPSSKYSGGKKKGHIKISKFKKKEMLCFSSDIIHLLREIIKNPLKGQESTYRFY